VNLRNAEDGHHCIADVLLDRAAMPSDHERHLVEVAQHQLPSGFRVEQLGEWGRAGDVAEEDRYRLPELGLGALQ
jgi:hypothetical protein